MAEKRRGSLAESFFIHAGMTATGLLFLWLVVEVAHETRNYKIDLQRSVPSPSGEYELVEISYKRDLSSLLGDGPSYERYVYVVQAGMSPRFQHLESFGFESTADGDDEFTAALRKIDYEWVDDYHVVASYCGIAIERFANLEVFSNGAADKVVEVELRRRPDCMLRPSNTPKPIELDSLETRA